MVLYPVGVISSYRVGQSMHVTVIAPERAGIHRAARWLSFSRKYLEASATAKNKPLSRSSHHELPHYTNRRLALKNPSSKIITVGIFDTRRHHGPDQRGEG